MAERVYRSADVPNFDTYPMTPPVKPVKEAGRLDPGLEEADRSSLENRAAALGAAAGKLVRMVRRKSADMGNLPQPDIASFVGEIVDYARDQVGRIRNGAAVRAQEIERLAKEKTAIMLRETQVSLVHARKRAQRVANDYPVQVALGAGAVGLLIGIGLRIRRANRA